LSHDQIIGIVPFVVHVFTVADVHKPSVVLASSALASSTKDAQKVLIVVLSGTVRDLIQDKLVTSLSINAPADVTFVVSVTSAPASIQSNLLQSVATSLQSTVQDNVMFQVTPRTVQS